MVAYVFFFEKSGHVATISETKVSQFWLINSHMFAGTFRIIEENQKYMFLWFLIRCAAKWAVKCAAGVHTTKSSFKIEIDLTIECSGASLKITHSNKLNYS